MVEEDIVLEDVALSDVVSELQQTNVHLEALTEELVSVKEYNWQVGNSVGICTCLLFLVALMEARNFVMSWVKRGVKDV